MLVPHNTLVVVADGRKLLFLRNEGDGDRPALAVERKDMLENPKDSDQKTDAAGRAAGGARRGHARDGRRRTVRSIGRHHGRS